jgi:hypothetical protein
MLALSCFSCTGTAARKSEVLPAAQADQAAPDAAANSRSAPDGLRFTPAPLPAEGLARAGAEVFGLGLITREGRDPAAGLSPAEKTALAASFRDAYAAGLLRGLPLDGVLGGDRVHGWPVASPVAWVQNWRSSDSYPNSWGIPSLNLAVRGLTREKAFVIHGPILDAYGKSGGVGGANGAAGYGAPRGEEYRWGNGIAQRFDFGLIIIDGSGKGIFLQEEAPSAKEKIPAGVGVLNEAATGGKAEAAGEVGEGFRSAWMSAVDRDFPALLNDGPVYHLDFSVPWALTSGSGASGETFALSGLLYQSFDKGKTLFIRGETPSGPGPGSVRVLTGPFLDALTGAWAPVPGAEALAEDPLPAGFEAQGEWVAALLQGIARYGFPLTDAIPQKDGSGKGWKEAQRFTRGWLITD